MILHFLTVPLALGLWLALGWLDERVHSPYLGVWLRGLRGGVLAAVLSLLIAVGVAHSPLVVVPEEARTWVFSALALALAMIGVPIGFLGALSRATRGGGGQGQGEP